MFLFVGCPRGFEIDEEHQFFCNRCPKGTYAENFDSPHCIHCSEGQTTNGRQTGDPSQSKPWCRDGKLGL